MKKLQLALIVAALVILFAGSAFAANIAIDAVNFPDVKFREVLAVRYPDWAGDYSITPEELADVKNLFIINAGISNLKGLEFFTALEFLDVGQNPLTSLDISKNTNLISFSCEGCGLSALDVSKNTNLLGFGCGDNNLSYLDISKNSQLVGLSCRSNKLTSLNVSKNSLLEYLDANNNKLSTLDLSKNPVLEYLDVSSNKFANLDISKNTKLQQLTARNNSLIALDVSKNPELYYTLCTEQVRTITITEYPDSSYTVKGAPYTVKFADIDPNMNPAKIKDLSGAVLDAAGRAFTNVAPGTNITYNYMLTCLDKKSVKPAAAPKFLSSYVKPNSLPADAKPKLPPDFDAPCYMDVTIIVKGAKGTLPLDPPTVPKTGDNTPLALYIALAVAALAVVAFALYQKRKKK